MRDHNMKMIIILNLTPPGKSRSVPGGGGGALTTRHFKRRSLLNLKGRIPTTLNLKRRFCENADLKIFSKNKKAITILI